MRCTHPSLRGASPGLERYAPPTRLLPGEGLLMGLFAVPPSSIGQVGWIVGPLALWVFVLRTPICLVLGVVLGTALIGNPVFLLAAMVGTVESAPPADGLLSGLLHAYRILLKDAAITLAALTTLSSLDAAHLQDGLRRLWVPVMLAGLVTQVPVQMGQLLEETESMVRAARLRIASSGPAMIWLLARRIPQMWLPRVLFRAERVALLGLNGSDKTTLLLAVDGLIPYSGRILIDGQELNERNAPDFEKDWDSSSRFRRTSCCCPA